MYSTSSWVLVAAWLERQDLGVEQVSDIVNFVLRNPADIRSTVAQAIYLAILNSTITKATVELVPAAAIKAGLKAADVPALMALVGKPDFGTTYDAAVVAAVGIAQKEVIRRGVQYGSLSSSVIHFANFQ